MHQIAHNAIAVYYFQVAKWCNTVKMLGCVFFYTSGFSLYGIYNVLFSFASTIGNPCAFVFSVFARMSVFCSDTLFFISLQQHFELANYFSLFLAMLLVAVAICKIGYRHRPGHITR